MPAGEALGLNASVGKGEVAPCPPCPAEMKAPGFVDPNERGDMQVFAGVAFAHPATKLIRLDHTTQRMVVRAREFDHALGDLPGLPKIMDSAYAAAVLMNAQHQLDCFVARFAKDGLQHMNDEFHRCLVVVQQKHICGHGRVSDN